MSGIINNFKLIIGQPKYKFISRTFSRNSTFNFLDVGGGSGKAAKDFKEFFPNANYYCIDLLDEEEYKQTNKGLFEDYWKVDLSLLDFSMIPDDFFDFVACTHVIEHLLNGDEMLVEIFKKIKPNGFIYTEYPCLRSLQLPSMPGTLNFFDDDTHCRIYSVIEMNNLLMRNKMRPLKSGTRRNWARLPLFPFLLTYKLLFSNTKGSIAYEFWDLLGFAEFIFAQKKLINTTIDPKSFK